MPALVTGGGGFLGRYIVEQLRARGEQVRVFARGAYPDLAELGVEVVRGDLTDAAAVSRACAGVDTVFHTAALPGVWGKWETYHQTNTVGTDHVLAGCVASGVRRLIYTSSPSVIYDGRPHENANESLPYPGEYLCHYPKSKAMAERAVLAANGRNGLLTCALRPHLIWGPRDNHLIPRLIQRAKSGRLRRVGDGKNLVSITYVENAATGHLQACDALVPGSPVAGQAYFINEPEPVPLWPWIDDVLSRAGLGPVRKAISAVAAYKLGALLEGAYTVLGLHREPPMTRFVAKQLAESHYYSVEKARRDFGFCPAVSMEAGLDRLTPDLRRLAGTGGT
ncbi:MAG: NAD-dependent epimerase/dehydratase family protein [Planctomycetaceae bacterium]